MVQWLHHAAPTASEKVHGRLKRVANPVAQEAAAAHRRMAEGAATRFVAWFLLKTTIWLRLYYEYGVKFRLVPQ